MSLSPWQQFRGKTGRPMGKIGAGGGRLPVSIHRPQKALDPAAMDHYWHPDRDGVEVCPDDFQRDLDRISDGAVVRIVRPPAGAPLTLPRAWLVWMRKPSVTHPLCPGWLLLIDWRLKGEPMPLDMRVFSYLYSVKVTTHGSAKAYFDTCVSDMDRDKAAKMKTHTDDVRDRSKDYFGYTKVKNIGRGNKFALHDATSEPSRGTANWLAERRRAMIPGELRKDEAQRREEALG